MSRSSRQIGFALRYDGTSPEYFVGGTAGDVWNHDLGPTTVHLTLNHLLLAVAGLAVSVKAPAPWSFMIAENQDKCQIGRVWEHVASANGGYGVKWGLVNWVTPIGCALGKNASGAVSTDAAQAFLFPSPRAAWQFALQQLTLDLHGDVGVYPLKGPETTTFEFRAL
jgi:hypothetical protein